MNTTVIAACAIAFAAGCADIAHATPTVRGELGKKVDDYLTRLEKFGFSGACLVSQKGEIVLEKGYGFANREKKIPFTEDTVSSIGSVTKQFTGAAILKLEMEGKLAVTDPISKFFPDAPPDKASITIHQLLTHTAGLGEVGLDDDDPIGRDAMLRQAFAMPLSSKPGERFEYSNLGFAIAAAIVEKVSGKTYEQYLHEKLFEPAGMKTTGYVIPKWNPERMAHGYDSDGRDAGTFESRNWGPNGPGWVLVGNGGILSTPGDMYRWHIALQGEAILSKAAKEKYTTPHVLTRMGDHYGYGWGLLTTPRKTKLVWHNGGNGIFFTDFRRYVDEDVVTYINSNGDVHATELGPNQLTSLVFGERDVTMPPRVVAVDPARVARLAGAYRTESGDEIRVAAAGEQITISGTSTPLFAMLSGLQRPGGTFARQEDLVRRVVESGAKGDFQAVRQAMGSNSPPLETVQRNQGARWKGWREEKGEYKGVEILGSVVRGPLRVFARILFEHGSQTLAYDWMGPDLIGIGPAGSEPTRVLLPQSASEFVRFNPQQSKPLLVRFDVEADGAAAGLTLSSESGDVTARRHD